MFSLFPVRATARAERRAPPIHIEQISKAEWFGFRLRLEFFVPPDLFDE
jgi:hypothetical protein